MGRREFLLNDLFSFQIVGQGSTNYDWQAKFGPHPIFVNKILLQHIHADLSMSNLQPAVGMHPRIAIAVNVAQHKIGNVLKTL